jgi:hypothetical protein
MAASGATGSGGEGSGDSESDGESRRFYGPTALVVVAGLGLVVRELEWDNRRLQARVFG